MKLEIANKILANKTFRRKLGELEELEKGRIFCGHGLDHLLGVARIAALLCAERGVEADPDVIYSAALLHDIGRVEEYSSGLPHELAGPVSAAAILAEVGCGEEEAEEIIRLIAVHRRAEAASGTLEAIFYEADKKSRACYLCRARSECRWPEEKRNAGIEA